MRNYSTEQSFPNRFWRLIIDPKNNCLKTHQNAESFLGEDLTIVNYYRSMIDYLGIRIQVYDHIITKLFFEDQVFRSHLPSLSITLDFPFKKYDNTTCVIMREITGEEFDSVNATDLICHQCLMVRAFDTCYIPRGIEIVDWHGSPLPKIENLIRREVGKILISKVSLSKTLLDICEYYLEGIKESKDIAMKLGTSYNTVNTQRKKIIKLGQAIAPGLDTIDKIASFLASDGIISPRIRNR